MSLGVLKCHNQFGDELPWFQVKETQDVMNQSYYLTFFKKVRLLLFSELICPFFFIITS